MTGPELLLMFLALASMGAAAPPRPWRPPVPPQPPPPGGFWTLAQLRSFAADHGFADPRVAAAIAMAESGGDPCAQGDPPTGVRSCLPNGKSQSFGLWQIYVPAHPQYDPASLLDPTYNALAALAISQGGTHWEPWSTAWEDPVRRIGYLGPKSPMYRYLGG